MDMSGSRASYAAANVSWVSSKQRSIAARGHASIMSDHSPDVCCRDATSGRARPAARFPRMDERALAERLMSYDSSTREGLRSAAAFVQGFLGSNEIDHEVRDFDGLPVI